MCLCTIFQLASWKVIHFGELRQPQIHPQTILQLCGVTGGMVTLLYGADPILLKISKLQRCCWPIASMQTLHQEPTCQSGQGAFVAQHRWEDWAVDGWGKGSLLDAALGRCEAVSTSVGNEASQRCRNWKSAIETAPKGLLGSSINRTTLHMETRDGSGDVRWGDRVSTRLSAFSTLLCCSVAF